MMNATLTQRGRAPHIARSFTVPLMASVPMSPPREKERAHHIGIRRESEPTIAVWDHSAVVSLGKKRIIERRKKQILQQFMHHPATITV